MKKLFSIILALMMLLAVMTSCTSDEPAEPAIPANISQEELPETHDPETDDPTDTVGAPPELVEIVIEPSDATPLMWLVTCPEGQTMYLFGSMHAGEPTLYPLSNTIMDAFYAADYLAVEVDMLAFYGDFAAQMAFLAMLEYEDGMTIIDEIGQELYDKAVQALMDLNLGFTIEDIEEMNSYKPWVWSNDIFTMLAVEFSGLSAFYGLDLFFLNEAYENGIEVLEVENLFDQLNILLGFSTELQKLMLEEALDIELAVEELLWLYDVFKYGNLEEITLIRESILDEMPEGLGEEFYQGLLALRDIGMADAVEQYFAEGKNVFYVVGLLHFVGESGIVDLLTQRGYAVELVPIN
jgi:hypothetical protein